MIVIWRLRGLRTLGVRLERQQQSALQVAEWLASRVEVKRVLFPALANDPGHAIWKRDFNGASSLFGLALECDEPAAKRWVDALELFDIGFFVGRLRESRRVQLHDGIS